MGFLFRKWSRMKSSLWFVKGARLDISNAFMPLNMTDIWKRVWFVQDPPSPPPRPPKVCGRGLLDLLGKEAGYKIEDVESPEVQRGTYLPQKQPTFPRMGSISNPRFLPAGPSDAQGYLARRVPDVFGSRPTWGNIWGNVFSDDPTNLTAFGGWL